MSSPQDGSSRGVANTTKNTETKSARKRRAQKERVNNLGGQLAKAQAATSNAYNKINKGSKGGGKGGKGGKPTKKEPRMKDGKGRFITDEEGIEICYQFHGVGCAAGFCHNYRSHKCQYCLGEHQNNNCRNRA